MSTAAQERLKKALTDLGKPSTPEQLMRQSGCKESTVHKTLAEMREGDEIEVVGRGERTGTRGQFPLLYWFKSRERAE